MTQRVLVTGGAGFIGSHLVDALVERGDEVVVFDDLSGGLASNVHPAAQLVVGSVVDPVAVERLFTSGFDIVYHLAAYAAEGLSHFIKRFNYQNNVVGSMIIVNAAVNHSVKHLVFTSSAAVYGAAQLPTTESTAPEPEDSYGIAKLTVERELAITERLFGLSYTIFRPHNVFGERQNVADRYRNVVGIFMRQVLEGRPMSVFGDGRQTRAFTHVSRILDAMLAAPHLPGARNEVFNIGAEQSVSVANLADLVRHTLGAPYHPIKHLPAREEVLHVLPDHTKARAVFGEPIGLGLEAGIQAMAAEAPAQILRPEPTFPRIEISRNLPAAWYLPPEGIGAATAVEDKDARDE